MADFTLDNIREAAEKKYKGMTIELTNGHTVELRNILRLPKEKRNEILALQEKDHEGLDESVEMIREVILLLADSTDNGKALIDVIGDDDAMLIHLFKTWQEQTQVGEAESSKS